MDRFQLNLKYFFLIILLVATKVTTLYATCPVDADDIRNNNITILNGEACSVSGPIDQGLNFGFVVLTIEDGGSLTINGDLRIWDEIIVNGDLIINGDFTSGGAGGATMTVGSTGSVLVNGDVGNGTFFTDGELNIDGQFQVTGDFNNTGNGTINGSGVLVVDGNFTDSGTNNLPGDCDSGCCGDSDTCDIILPIELISFTASLSGSVVNINWATATELNNDFFTIERSEDGINWTVIGEVDGAGDAHVRLDYQYIDYDPIPGISYYRLKQTDFDGQFEYFDPSVVFYEPSNVFKAFPNPVQNHLNVTTSSELENAAISIKSLNGQLLRADQVIISSHQAQLDLGHLPAGVYILEIVFPESNLSTRIVKQ
jgi:hypothetical protein